MPRQIIEKDNDLKIISKIFEWDMKSRGAEHFWRLMMQTEGMKARDGVMGRWRREGVTKPFVTWSSVALPRDGLAI
jgi:hypothetical protein